MNHEETRKSVVPSGGLHGIEVRPIRREERTRWDELMRQYHYLGLHSLIG
ncbi:MAG: putative transposase, partial [Candidatus Brocadia fulgida]